MHLAPFLLAILSSAALVAADAPILDGGVADFADNWGGGMSKSVNAVPGKGQVLQIAVTEQFTNFREAQTWVTPIKTEVAAGDKVVINILARWPRPARRARSAFRSASARIRGPRPSPTRWRSVRSGSPTS